jgi:hypothetical protein
MYIVQVFILSVKYIKTHMMLTDTLRDMLGSYFQYICIYEIFLTVDFLTPKNWK